jgi:hypothetical protein
MKPPYDPAKAVNSTALQTLLVQEFRTCQRAFQLLLDEQQALLNAVYSTAGDTQELLNLASAIDSTLENLEQIASTRLRLAGRAQKSRRNTESHLPGLQEGVHVLRGQISSIMRSNTALAGKALDQAQTMQYHLARPLEQTCFPEVFAAVLDARHALETGDRRAIAGALDDLQILIARLEGHTQSAPGETHTPADIPQPAKAGGLAEKIAALHHRQNAYRAVFQSGQRMLSPGNY